MKNALLVLCVLTYFAEPADLGCISAHADWPRAHPQGASTPGVHPHLQHRETPERDPATLSASLESFSCTPQPAMASKLLPSAPRASRQLVSQFSKQQYRPFSAAAQLRSDVLAVVRRPSSKASPISIYCFRYEVSQPAGDDSYIFASIR